MMKSPMIAFVSKEFKHILRDKRTMLILVIMPVLLIFLLGFALSTDIRNVNVVFMSDTDDDMVQRVVNRIDMSEYFTVVGRVYSTDEISEMMLSSKADAAVRFCDGQGLQIIVDASNPNMASSEAMYLRNIIYEQLSEEYDLPKAAVEPKIRMLYNPRMQSSFNFVPGVLGLILILICAMMTSASIVREKESGTMEVLLTSPVRVGAIIIAKMVPYFILSCVNIASILLLAKFALGVPLAGSLWLIILFAVIYTVMSLSLLFGFHFDLQPDDSADYLSHSVDDSGDDALGNALYDRKYARILQSPVAHRSGTLVHRCYAEAYDRGTYI